MNKATADNNGVYLLDGCHSNGCRQSERESEGERETGSAGPQLCSVDPVTAAPLSLSMSPYYSSLKLQGIL